MTIINLPLNLDAFKKGSKDYKILADAQNTRKTVGSLLEEERYMDALERTVSIMREMREFSDFSNLEFRTLLAAILFDLAEIHFRLKDYKQSEKELNILFKVAGRLVKEDAGRYGEFHILAMELAARILRSRKKAMELLEKERLNADALYEKVNSGIASATERLAESLRKIGELLAASGSYKKALKFYAEAIRFSKKSTGHVGRTEIKMTIEMAEVMSRLNSMRKRAKRLLAAVLPHAIALEIVELEEDIIALMEMIDKLDDEPSKWAALMQGMEYVSKLTDKVKDKVKDTVKEGVTMAREGVTKVKDKVTEYAGILGEIADSDLPDTPETKDNDNENKE